MLLDITAYIQKSRPSVKIPKASSGLSLGICQQILARHLLPVEAMGQKEQFTVYRLDEALARDKEILAQIDNCEGNQG